MANDFYSRLNDSNVDFSFPGLLKDTESGFSFGVTVKSQRGEPQEQSSFQRYGQLPQEISGTVSGVSDGFRQYKDKLKDCHVTLYKQYAQALDIVNIGHFQGLYNYLKAAIEAYRVEELVKLELTDIQLRFKTTYPAAIKVYCDKCNQGLNYTFTDKRLVLFGFPDAEKIDFSKLLKHIPKDLNPALRVKEIAESKVVVLPLCEMYMDNNDEPPTVDEIVDRVIKRLVVREELDTLQDILHDEDTVIFCFDPILLLDEIQDIVSSLKLLYPQAVLVSEPGNDTGAWWCVEITKIEQVAQEVAAAGQQSVDAVDVAKGTMAKPSNTLAAQITQDLDLNKALEDV